VTHPLVTIICINYNQGKFLTEAINSVYDQTYTNTEVFLVDNASTDGSDEIIKNLLQQYPSIHFIQNNTNEGICKAFNKAFGFSKGKYVIDLAADDVLLPTRIENQVGIFENLPENYAIIFSNAQYIDTDSNKLHFHYPINENKKVIDIPPSGDIYKEIFGKPFICTPTQLMRSETIKKLGGYDENLSYEDFDYWVRSSREYLYYYQDEITTLKRIVKKSITFRFYEKGENVMLESTYQVLKKAIKLNKTIEENIALASNIRFNLRQAFFTHNFELAQKLFQLLVEMNEADLASKLLFWAAKCRIPMYSIYKIYLHLRYGKLISSNI
jgi:glycosyltransferase involved in cell wall biosynthesis